MADKPLPGKPPHPAAATHLAAPAVHTVRRRAVGTVIRREGGNEQIFQHGEELDLPSEEMRRLVKLGAATHLPVAEVNQAGIKTDPEAIYNEETGKWVDADGIALPDQTRAPFADQEAKAEQLQRS